MKLAWAYFRPLAVSEPSGPPRAAFARLRRGESDLADRRAVEVFLLERCLELATEHGLPVKVHLGHLAGTSRPELRWVPHHVTDVVPLVHAHPRTTFVLMHAGCVAVVETVVGHAELARRGLQAALERLVRDEWLTPDDALALVPELMRGNALRIFG